MSNIYTLFSISTSCLESENVVLHKYVLRRLLQRQVQDIILGYSEQTSTFIFYKSIDLCIVESLMMELLMVFILYWRDLSQMLSVCQRNGILIGKENAVAQ